MIVFGEANFMLPRVTLGFHSWGNVVSADFLRRSCCAPCLCAVQTLAPVRSAFAPPPTPSFCWGINLGTRSIQRFLFRRSGGGSSETSQVGLNALMGKSRRGSGSADVVPVCLCLFFLRFCRISGQLNCGAANGYFGGECRFFFSQDFSTVVVMSPNINSFFFSQEYKNLIYSYLIQSKLSFLL